MATLLNRQSSAALGFLVAGGFWFMVGTTYGLFSAVHFIAPEFFDTIPALVFGRARPVHVNTVLYGFVTTTLIGCGLHITPAVLRTRLWSEPMGWASWFFWNAAVASGPFTFAFGLSQGREYTEYLWIFDLSLMLAVLLLIVNGVMTILRRNEDTLYVSVWYFIGAFLWTAGTYPIGNVMWHPSTGAMAGLLDPIFHWFYGHTLPGLILTPLAVGAAYYVVPRVVRQPLNSHTLSLVGFWTLVVFYTHIGGHHILQAPIPNWLKVVSVVNSAAMVVPVFVALANLWLTARGFGGRLLADPAARLVIAGTVWYLIVCVQGPLQSMPFMQRVTHLNNWTVGHSHIAVLGFAGFIAVGTLWHVLPSIVRRRVWSLHLVNLQFGLLMFGITGFFIVLTIAGLVQGESWDHGETVYKVLPRFFSYMVARAALGISIILSAYIGFYNLLMTLYRGEPFDPRPLDEEDLV
ncbi:MAG: cbb3-type cytochrome c oxidase subunit I [Thermodesulfovibrionales bacterium]